MDPTIGDSYVVSIGQGYFDSSHTQPMSHRTVWQRMKEALSEARKPSTQVEVAKALDIQQPSISDWNKPGGYPSIENAVAVARMAGCCVEWLLTGRGPKRLPPTDPEAQQLWTTWAGLTPTAKSRLLAYAAGLLDAGDGVGAADPDKRAG